MSRGFVRMGVAPAGVSLVIAAALVLAGCAWQNGQSSSEMQTGVAPMTAPATQPAPPPKPKVVEGKKPAIYAPASKGPPQSAASHEEASCANVEGCASVLKAMIADPNRAWAQRPATPTILANGVRLFAYRALRPKLTCRELGSALSEIDAAAQAYSGTIAGLPAEQASRAQSLCLQVGEELRAERSSRCSAQSKSAT